MMPLKTSTSTQAADHARPAPHEQPELNQEFQPELATPHAVTVPPVATQGQDLLALQRSVGNQQVQRLVINRQTGPYPTGSTVEEEQKIRQARQQLPGVVDVFQQIVSQFRTAFNTALQAPNPRAAAEQLITSCGESLWAAATSRVQQSMIGPAPTNQPATPTNGATPAATTNQPATPTNGATPAPTTNQPAAPTTSTPATPANAATPAQPANDQADDRPLYWARLQIAQHIRSSTLARDAAVLQALLNLLDNTSRGRTTVNYTTANAKRILISGFDPFGGSVTATNPSGAAALALDGKVITGGTNQQAQIQSVVFPVRFNDFDAGAVESFFRPYMQGPQAVDMIVTISMDGGNEFNLDRFVGRYRNPTHPDNRDLPSGHEADFGVPRNQQPEFLESTLPIGAMQQPRLTGSQRNVNDDRTVETLQDGETTPANLAALNGKTARAGAGGDYLSNEISYRTLLLRRNTGATLPVGHLHVPALRGGAPNVGALRAEIVTQIEQILQAALPTLYPQLPAQPQQAQPQPQTPAKTN